MHLSLQNPTLSSNCSVAAFDDLPTFLFPFLSCLSEVFYIKPPGYALSCTSSISGGWHNTLSVEKLCFFFFLIYIYIFFSL